MIPSSHRLRAALIVASVLDDAEVQLDAVHDSYARLPTGGLYRSEDLVRGEELLTECGLIQINGAILIAKPAIYRLRLLTEQDGIELLLSLWLAHNPPLWFTLATQDGGVVHELIPTEDLVLISDLVPDPNRRDALLMQLARRFDPMLDKKLPERGEEHVVAQCKAILVAAGRADLAAQVQRVSLISDQLGYDVVTPNLQEQRYRIEVKTCGKPGDKVRFFLSRSEAEYGLREPSWRLVVCQANPSGQFQYVGWMTGGELYKLLPKDTDPQARWKNTEIVIHKSLLKWGLPIAIKG